jgi:hypothetical protein
MELVTAHPVRETLEANHSSYITSATLQSVTVLACDSEPLIGSAVSK